MGDHGFGQVTPACYQTFMAYSWDIVANIEAGKLVVVP
jgi:hypothetical protein